MSMVVRTNIMAVNANNNLIKNNSKVSKSLEKLSSGFRINRAADDASGLAMSEKMKAQITALESASTNCQDGISFIQTAEGYTSEIHDMLNRMVELAQKAANGVMETVSGGIEAEHYGAAGTDRQALQDEMDQLCAEIDRVAMTANFNNLKLFDGTLDTNAVLESGDNGVPLKLQIGETDVAADKITVSVDKLTTDSLFQNIDDNVTYTGTDDGFTLTVSNESSTLTGGLTLNISNQDAASSAAVGIRNAINNVSSLRGRLGAVQNRLEYTISNLNTAAENMTSANSRIRDTDMAEEMTTYTQFNVLTQAAQAMLAQANTQPQSILQLLQ